MALKVSNTISTTDIRLPKDYEGVAKANQDTPAKKVYLIAYCRLGGGHKSAADAAESAIRAKYNNDTSKFEVYKIDMYDAVRAQCDAVYKLARTFGLNYTFEDVYAFSQKTGLLMILNLVSGPLADCSDGFFDLKRKMEVPVIDAIRKQFLKYNPDVIVSTTPIPLGPMLRVAQGGVNGKQIPVVKIATDTEAVIDEVNTNNPLYFTCAMSDHELSVGRIKKVLPPEQIIKTGYPIRPEFLEKPTETQLQTWRKEWGIGQGKAALFSNGANGIPSDLPERILRSKEKFDDDVHLFIVCGDNKDYYDRLDKLSKLPDGKKNPRVFLHPLKRQDASKMHELMCVSNVVVGKQGGATAAEIFYSGTKLLVDHSLGAIWWEQHNFKALEMCGMAEAYRSNSEFDKKLKDMLFNPKPINEGLRALFTDPTPLENMVRVIDMAIEKAEATEERGDWYPLPERFYHEKNKVIACVEDKFNELHTAPLGYKPNFLEQAGAFLSKPFVKVLNIWNQPKTSFIFKVALVALSVIFAPIMLVGLALQFLGKTIHHEKKIVTDAVLKRTEPSVIDDIYDGLRLIDEQFRFDQIPYLAAGSTLRSLMDRGGLFPWEKQGTIKIRDRDVERIMTGLETIFEDRGFVLEGPKNGKIIVKPKDGGNNRGQIELRICTQREDGLWEYTDPKMKESFQGDVVSDQEFHADREFDLQGIRSPSMDFGPVGHPARFSLRAPLFAKEHLRKLEGSRWLEEIIVHNGPIASTYQIVDKEAAVGQKWARPEVSDEEKVA